MTVFVMLDITCASSKTLVSNFLKTKFIVIAQQKVQPDENENIFSV